jgi:LuxR family maltose regulon positive regulatory protein
MSISTPGFLLQTKLRQPRLSRGLVARPRLIKELESPSSLVLVIAPAGYGKTTLVSSWLESAGMPSAWLAIDEADNDLASFVHYLIGAVQSCFPEVGARTANLLLKADSLAPASVSRSLLIELAEIDQEFILVLDDYQLIHNSAIHQLLTDIVRHPPEGLHLVVAARNDPALPLPGLRARGQVTELRARDLSFTLEETADFLRNVMQLDISDEEVAHLKHGTEGWAASLRLAAIHYGQTGSTGLVGTGPRGGNRYLIDYMVDEVLARIPEEVRDFLLKTSILNQMHSPLCDEIVGYRSGEGRSEEILSWLEGLELFTLPVVREPGWYRYHHLFRQLLLHELKNASTQEEIAALHLRASGWFERQGRLSEAISHALAGGEPQAAAKILARHRRDLINLYDWRSLESLLKLFPRDLVERDAELMLAESALMLFQAKHRAVREALDRAESLIPSAGLSPDTLERIEGEIALGRGALAYWAGDLTQTTSQVRSALEKLPADWWELRQHAKLFLGVALQIQGRKEEAAALFDATSEPSFGPSHQAERAATACFIHWAAADLTEVERNAVQILDTQGAGQVSTEAVNWAHYFLGVVNYHHGKLEEAEQHLLPLILHPQRVHSIAYFNATAALALTYQIQGQGKRAIELAEALLSFSRLGVSGPGLDVSSALRAELALRQGDVLLASRWAEGYELPAAVRLPAFYGPPLTYARVLLAEDTPTSRRLGLHALSSLEKTFASEHQTTWLMQTLVLKASALLAENEERGALLALRRAVELAEPGGFIQIFLDLGERAKPLLSMLARRGVSPAYIGKILAAFEQQAARSGERRSDPRTSDSEWESLGVTKREEDVLSLLMQRYSDKEIAEALMVSKDTVHSHVMHLGEKLGAHGRRAIAERARELGFPG